MRRLFDDLLSRAFGDAWAPGLARFRAEARAFASEVTGHRWFERGIIALIIVNAVLLGVMTDADATAAYGGVLERLDRLILVVFVIELGLRLAAQGRGFFRSGWNWFDLVVIGISFIPATSELSILRAARVLRLLRLISVAPKMRRVIGGLFAAIPGMAGVMGVLAVVFYVSAVITTMVFGQASLASAPPSAAAEDVETVRELFGTLSRSFFTLFQLMTLEDWAGGIVKPTLAIYPDALWFFIPFIVVTSFAVLNLFIGIIVEAMQDERQEERRDEAQEAADPARDAEAEPAKPLPEPSRPPSALERDEVDLLLREIRSLRAETRRLAESVALRQRAAGDEVE